MKGNKSKIVKSNKVKVIKKKSIKKNKKKYVMVRTYSAGVFAGYLKSRKGQEVILESARRIYYWEGAATLSQLSQEGTSSPLTCKFPCEVNEVLLLNAIEIINITEKAKKSINSVPIWEV